MFTSKSRPGSSVAGSRDTARGARPLSPLVKFRRDNLTANLRKVAVERKAETNAFFITPTVLLSRNRFDISTDEGLNKFKRGFRLDPSNTSVVAVYGDGLFHERSPLLRELNSLP